MVYIIAFIFLILLLFIGKYYHAFNRIVLLIPMLLVGLRDGVGVDYYSYEQLFYNIDFERWLEPSYWFINKLVASYHGHFYNVNIIVSSITLLFFYYGVRQYKALLGMIIICYLLSQSGYLMMVNGVRQSVAIGIYIFALHYIQQERLGLYLLFVLFAATFHLSALFLIPFYWILKIRLSYWLYFVVFVLALMIGYLGYSNFIIDFIFSLFLYSRGIDQLASAPTDSGFGVILLYSTYITVMLFSQKWLSDKSCNSVLFNCFFCMCIFRFLFSSNMSLQRMYLYFELYSFIYTLLLINYRFRRNSRLIVQLSLITMYILLFVVGVTNPRYSLIYHFVDL